MLILRPVAESDLDGMNNAWKGFKDWISGKEETDQGSESDSPGP